MSELVDIEHLEADLWDAADNLRANSKLTAGEYCMPVLGVIFLRHATNRYNAALREIEADQAAGKMPKRPLTAADFKKRRALMLPKQARYDELLALPKGADLGTALVDAMNAIERDFEPLLNQLPKDYTKFEKTLLEDLLRVFDSVTLRNASGDVFGRINEYFLMKFAMQGAQDNGEFFTPPSLGFVMSSQASSAGHGEAEVRRKIVETGAVDVMISIRSNFFYTRTVPCELWHFDKGKQDSPSLPSGERAGVRGRDTVLMIDARNIYRKVTRKIYDFSPEQLQNLTAIVWLYRGQFDRFIALVQQHLERTLTEAAGIAGKAAAFRQSYDALLDAAAPFLKTLLSKSRSSRRNEPQTEEDQSLTSAATNSKEVDAALRELVKERDDSAKSCLAALDKWTARVAKDWKKPCDPKLAAQKKLLAELDDLATACRDLVKDVDLVFKLATRVVDALGTQRERLLSPALSPAPSGREGEETPPAERTSELPRPARNERGEGRGEGLPELDSRTLRRLVKELEARRKETVEQLKATAYFERQAHWLLSRFPDAKLVPVPGLVRLVDRKEIEAADWSLTPGRYVGVAPPEVDEDFDFEQTLSDIHVELADLNQEAAVLSKTIQKNFEGLGV